MRNLIRGLCGLAGAALLFASTAAHAESRLFTARANSTGVSIVRAVHNGVDLAVAGQSGGSTFFRIDNPSGAVPCVNRIVFVASDGRTVDTNIDFCATNWEVVVSLAGGGQQGGGAAPAVAVPSPGAGQPVVIAVDDPSVTIMEVFLRGQPVPVNARQDPYVRIVAPTGALGVECQRDLGLALSDGRRIARMVDICQNNALVIVALAGGPRPPPPPQAFLPAPPQVPQPQPQPQPQPLPQPGPQPQPDFIDNLVWMFNADGNNGGLAYAVPNSDGAEFSAVCQRGSGQMTVTLNRAPPDLTPGRQVSVRFTAGAFSQVYTATGSPVSELSGHAHPVIQIPASDQLWPALARENVFSIAIGQMPPYGLSLRGSAANVRPFLAFCAQQVAPPPPPDVQPPPMPGPGANIVGFRCNDGAFLSVAFDQDTALVNEPGFPPVVLLRTPGQGAGARYVGGGSELIGLAEQILWTRAGSFGRTCIRS